MIYAVIFLGLLVVAAHVRIGERTVEIKHLEYLLEKMAKRERLDALAACLGYEFEEPSYQRKGGGWRKRRATK